MYDKFGKIIPGWKNDKTDNIISKPVQYFKAGGKDYIVAIDKYKFYILDRKGDLRVNVKNYFQVSERNIFYLDLSKGEKLASLITTDAGSNIQRVYLNGKVEKIKSDTLSRKHYFIYNDIDGNNKAEYILVSGNKLKVLGNDLSQWFEEELPDTVSSKPVIYQFSGDNSKIGIVLGNQGNIYLYNRNGTIYNGFPLEGSTQFSISSFPERGGRFNLIVGTKKNFLYNYSIK
jgi:hypothetical protein